MFYPYLLKAIQGQGNYRVNALLVDRDNPDLAIIARNLRQAKVIDASNVAQNFYESGQEPDISKLPPLTPPFTSTWIEYQVPERVHLSGLPIEIGQSNLEVKSGFLVDVNQTDDFADEIKVRDTPQRYMPAVQQSHWIVRISMIQIYKKVFVAFGEPALTILLDERGYLIPLESESRRTLRSRYSVPDGWIETLLAQNIALIAALGMEHDEAIDRILTLQFYPVLLTLGFLNCKNVIIHREKRVKTKKIKSINRRHHKPKIPPIDIHTLRIQPLRQINRYGNKGSSGHKLPLHIVRGHFRDYRERGLFGRVFGVFWVPDHARGDKQVGRVKKDYKVEAT